MLCLVLHAEADLKDHMFGIRLRPAAARLLKEVEQHYGRPVREELVHDWEPNRVGEARVSKDGTPIIRMNAGARFVEVDVVHELLHLKWRAMGFESPELSGPLARANAHYFQYVAFSLFDPLVHKLFYPAMRKMGFEPNAAQREAIKQAIRNDRIENIAPPTAQEFLALYYFQASLELGKDRLVSDLAQSGMNDAASPPNLQWAGRS